MKYWAVVDNDRKGPFELDELIKLQLKPDTFVWHEGLIDWIRANELVELNTYFENFSEPKVPPMIKIEQESDNHIQESEPMESSIEPSVPIETVITATEKEEPKATEQEGTQKGTSSSYSSWFQYQQNLKCPNNYIAISIIALIIMFPLGLVALISSLGVQDAYYSGNYAKAKRNSNLALGFSIASFTIGIQVFIGLASFMVSSIF